MQNNFDNSKNRKVAHGAIKIISKLGFSLSTLTSAVSMVIFTYFLINSMLVDIVGEGWILNAAIIAASAGIIYMCYVVDFHIIQNAGKFFASESFAYVAAKNGVFKPFNKLRSIPIFLWFIIFSGGFALSFITSWNGSDLIKAYISPKVSAKKYDIIMNDRAKETVSATKAQDEKLVKLLEDKKAAIANAGNPELKKQAKKGDVWANTELEKQQTAAAKAYDRQIAATEKSRAEVAKAFEGRYAAIEKAKFAEADAEVNSTLSQAGAISGITKGLGVLPLIIAVLGVFILAIGEVSEQAEGSKRTRNNSTGGASGYGGKSGKRKGGTSAANF
jgi:hypothetical protein